MEILGIDIGGSGIKGAIVDSTHGTLTTERHRLETPQPATPQAVAHTVRQMVDHFAWKGPIGFGFPAVIQHGIARTASNVDKKWIGTDAQSLFEEATGCPVSVINDADAAGLAETNFGAGKGRKGLILVLTVGTGIGSALINQGSLIPNTELGYLRFKGDIAEHYVSDSVRRKEDLSWGKWGERFNAYLHHVSSLFYPDLIIVGGGASKKFDRYQDKIDLSIPVVPATLLNEAGIIGAALAAKTIRVEL
jgi:polyphosphate glucokinase